MALSNIWQGVYLVTNVKCLPFISPKLGVPKHYKISKVGRNSSPKHEWETFMLTQQPSQSYYLSNLECISHFEHIVQSHQNTSFWCPFITTSLPIYYHSNIDVPCIKKSDHIRPTKYLIIVTTSKYVFNKLTLKPFRWKIQLEWSFCHNQTHQPNITCLLSS